MNLPVIVLGAGGHAKVLLDALKIKNVEIIGLTDKNPQKKIDFIPGVAVLGDDREIFKHSPDTVRLVNGLGTIKSGNERQKIYERFKEMGYNFADVIHPSTIVSQHIKLFEGVQIMAGSVIQTGCIIGKNTIINTNVSIDHDCRIGDHVHIAPGVTICGEVEVGEGAHIGTGAVLLQGIQIGRNSTIGAGAIVTRNIPEGITAVGNPARW